jgi:hypothetical protein
MTTTSGVKIWIDLDNTPAVDRKLEHESRLTLIRSAKEVWTRIPFTHRDKCRPPTNSPRPALDDIVNYIEEIIRLERVGSHRRAKASKG